MSRERRKQTQERIDQIFKCAECGLGYDENTMRYGPAHIVWDDLNYDQAEWCLEHFDDYRKGHSDKALDVVRKSLEKLAQIPLEDREDLVDHLDAGEDGDE